MPLTASVSSMALAISSLVDGDFQPDGLGRVPQPVEVLGQAEDLAAVAADALEHAVAVEQAVVVDADLGVFLVVELAVDVDFQGHGDIRGKEEEQG